MAIALVGTWTQSVGRFVGAKTSGSRTSSSGNGIVVIVHVRGPSVPSLGTSDVTDSKSNTYTRLAYITATASSQYSGSGIYYCANPSSTGASHTVTYTDTNNTSATIMIEAIEISGQNTSGGADQTATASATSGTAGGTGTTGTTTQADEISIALCSFYNFGAPVVSATPSGYTDIANAGYTDGLNGPSAYKILSATGTQSASWTFDAACVVTSGCIATIKAAAGSAYSQSVAGTPASLSASITKQTNIPVAGAPASESGAVVRKTYRSIVGAPTSEVGAVAKSTIRQLSGISGSFTGIITRLPMKAVNGVIIGAGEISKGITRILSGAAGAASGVMNTTRMYIAALIGGITSVAGDTTKLSILSKDGSIQTISGIITKSINKILTGVNGALSGVINYTRIFFSSLVGSLTSTGIISRNIYKSLSGSYINSGIVSKKIARTMSGLFTFTGTVSSSALVMPRVIMKAGRGFVTKIRSGIRRI